MKKELNPRLADDVIIYPNRSEMSIDYLLLQNSKTKASVFVDDIIQKVFIYRKENSLGQPTYHYPGLDYDIYLESLR